MQTILTKINKLVGGNAIPSKQRSAKPSKQRSAKLSKHSKPAFTIIELLMVVGIIAVLATLVTTASVATMRSSREKRRDAMRIALEAAISTYHAQDSQEKWPGAIENLAEGADSGVLTEDQAQSVFRDIVKKSIGASGAKNPLIDPSGLFVAPGGAVDGKSSGLGFTDALHGGPHRKKIGVGQMVFGYQGRKSGRFRRFNVIYHAEADSVKVSTCCHDCCGVNGCTKNGGAGYPLCPCHRDEE